MNSFGLPQDVLSEMIAVLRGFPQIKGAKIFGSRAKGTHKRYSDVDIAIFAEEEPHLAANVQAALDDLDVVYYFDMLHYEMTVNEAIKAHIDRVGVEIMPCEKNPRSEGLVEI